MTFIRLAMASAAAMLAQGAALAQDQAIRPLVTDPVWSQTPSLADFQEAYPGRLAREKAPASAVVSCRIAEGGTLGDCRVMTEAPGGKGVGRAAMGLTGKFRAAEHDKQGEPVAGRVVDLPIAFRLKGQDELPTAHQPGEPAVLVTQGLDGPGEDLECPSSDDPERMCKTHGFAWIERPTVRGDAELIRSAGRRDGVSFMECARGEDGRLAQCAGTGDTPERSKEAMLALAARFRAPETAGDGAPLSAGRILLTWDWAAIMDAVKTAERLPATEPARP